MRITVIGATGMVGSRVTAEAVRRRHQVTAVSRRPSESPHTAAGTTATLAADFTAAGAPDAALAGADALVLSVPPVLDDAAAVTGSMHRLLDAAASADVRVLVVGGAGPLRIPGDPARLAVDDETFVPAAWRSLARASLAQLRACESHAYRGWTYLSPPALLEPGERTGTYRWGRDTLLTDAAGASRISAEDLAVAVVDELERPAGAAHLTVAY
ncbi:NAD(P)-dependent oxidoreductase [Streptomyces sp. NPDC093546]|uniref:NAD(P)-dependent oxidoreductase n=1 Tax=Streptomyces sp. NPDC093546 TaxID=3366040 RepID=UPI003813D006